MKAKHLILCLLAFASLAAFRATGWERYTATDAKCSILFPGTPDKNTQESPSDKGKVKIISYLYEPQDPTDENLMYGLYFMQLPVVIHADSTAMLKSFFDNGRDGLIKNSNGKLIAEKNIKLGKYPGREFTVDIENGSAIMTMRFYLVKDRMYQLQTFTYPIRNPNPSISAFFDSFKLFEE